MTQAASICVLRAFRRLLVVIAALLLLAPGASAQHVYAREFGEAAGLGDDAVRQLVRTEAGYFLVGTQSGLYIFDGRGFYHMGLHQGLREHFNIQALAVDAAGRMAVADNYRIFISDDTSGTPINDRMFEGLAPAPVDTLPPHLAWWRGRLMVSIGGRLRQAWPEPPGAEAGPDDAPWATVHDAMDIVARGDTLYAGTRAGDICTIRPHSVRCDHVVPTSGATLDADGWVTLALGPDGTVYARSARHFAMLRADRPPVIEAIADDANAGSITNPVLLTVTPGNTVITSSFGRLMTRDVSQWRLIPLPMRFRNAAPTSIVSGADGALWFCRSGAGLVEVPNYGAIVSYDASDGFDMREIWQIERGLDGRLLIATARGILSAPGSDLAAGRLIPNASSTLMQLATSGNRPPDGMAADPFWVSNGNQLLRLFDDTSDTPIASLATPPLRMLLNDGTHFWLASTAGIATLRYGEDGRPSLRPDANFHGSVLAMMHDDLNRLWIAGTQRLALRQPDGHVETLLDRWPDADFQPASVLQVGPQDAWVAGYGGIYDVRRHGPGIAEAEPLRGPSIVRHTIYTLMRDHRSRIWLATDHGAAAFDGRRWINIATNDGLIWNDTDENALYADRDGTIWVGTSIGLSHILYPDAFFRAPSPRVVISQMRLGDAPVGTKPLAYSRLPLLIQLAAPAAPHATSLRFRYRLDGVDADWAETGGALIRYPALPPGFHRFEAMAFDPLTGDTSPVARITLFMREPWWWSWPLQSLYLLAALGVLVLGHELRNRLLLRQRRLLQRTVAIRTRELEGAKAALEYEAQTVAIRTRELENAKSALEYEAQTDSVTGLLNRRAIQRALSHLLDPPSDRPSGPGICAAGCTYVVTLLDLDHFKRINDDYGHLAGDEVLAELGRRLTSRLLPGEYCGRYGGEEFLFVAPVEARDEFGRVVALTRDLTRTAFRATSQPIAVTLSAGVATAEPDDDWQSVVTRADKALYHAKSAGRDRVVASLRDHTLHCVGAPASRLTVDTF